MTVQRRPFNVRCGSCEHTFTPLYTPMAMLTAAKILKDARCPKCGAGADQLFAQPTTQGGS